MKKLFLASEVTGINLPESNISFRFMESTSGNMQIISESITSFNIRNQVMAWLNPRQVKELKEFINSIPDDLLNDHIRNMAK